MEVQIKNLHGKKDNQSEYRFCCPNFNVQLEYYYSTIPGVGHIPIGILHLTEVPFSGFMYIMKGKRDLTS